LFVPSLGRFLNRTPTYTLTRRPSVIQEQGGAAEEEEPKRPRAQRTDTGTFTLTSSISVPGETRYAVLPEGCSLEGWSTEDKKDLNDHVRHLLHSRKAKFRRGMRGFGQYLRRRRLFSNLVAQISNNMRSSGLFCHCLRHPHHHFWTSMGIVLNRMDKRGRTQILYYQYNWQCIGCALRHYGRWPRPFQSNRHISYDFHCTLPSRKFTDSTNSENVWIVAICRITSVSEPYWSSCLVDMALKTRTSFTEIRRPQWSSVSYPWEL